MKEATTYECDFCAMQYSNQLKCVDCEASHYKVDELVIQSVEYNKQPVNVGFPDTIHVVADGGEVNTYKLY